MPVFSGGPGLPMEKAFASADWSLLEQNSIGLG
jgi:hypothetical protein